MVRRTGRGIDGTAVRPSAARDATARIRREQRLNKDERSTAAEGERGRQGRELSACRRVKAAASRRTPNGQQAIVSRVMDGIVGEDGNRGYWGLAAGWMSPFRFRRSRFTCEWTLPGNLDRICRQTAAARSGLPIFSI